MRMIPAIPHGTHSPAEKKVFDYLRLAHQHDNSLVAYHSLNLTRHAYKRFGEIDFLICGNDGLFVLEVKGGGLRSGNGIWFYTNRYGQQAESAEGPFRQAESALHGLVDNLRAKFSDKVISQFTIGYGVIFPDCEWQSSGAEWDPHTLADAHHTKNFGKWLQNLFEYWKRKDNRHRQPDDSALKEVKHYLRPEFEAVIPLHILAGEIEDKVTSLTEDQMSLVDVVTANPRVLCSGGAGTGKTYLAMELARRWTSQGLKVLLACRSPWLKCYLESRFIVAGLSVSLASSVLTTASRLGLDKFDALIVDEGQDLFDMNCLDRLDAVLRGGFTDGQWCFFYDKNNQSGFFGQPEQEAIDFLHQCRAANVPLRTNCRNSRVILEKVQHLLHADMGVRGVGEGPAVQHNLAKSQLDSAQILADEIHKIIDSGGLADRNVTILSPYSFAESSAALLPDSVKKHLIILDEYSLRNFPPNAISFAEISNFKGLENEVVIVIDLQEPPKHEGFEYALHYVAMSRARAVLSLIFLPTRFLP